MYSRKRQRVYVDSRNTLSMYVVEIVTLIRPGRFSVVFYDVIKAGGGIAPLQTSLREI